MKTLSVVIVFLILIAYLPVAINAEQDNITLKIYTDKQIYVDTDNVYLTYIAYNTNGRVVGGGNGTWRISDEHSGKIVANGTLVGSHGIIKIPLFKYNLTYVGIGRKFEIEVQYTYQNLSKTSYTSIKIIDSQNITFQISVFSNSANNEFYPSSLVTIKINSPVINEKIRYLTIIHSGTIWRNLTNIAIGYNGTYTYSFTIPNSWKNGDIINITGRIENSTAEKSFRIGASHDIYLEVSPSDRVISGDTLNISVHYSNITSPYFHFYIFSSANAMYGSILYRFFTDKNHISYKIPATYTGNLEIRCDVFNSSKNLGSPNTILNVKYGVLKIYTDHRTYSGGEKIRIFTMLRSHVIKNPTYVYIVYSNEGSLSIPYYEKTTKSSLINFTLPEKPAESYRIVVKAVNGSYSVMAHTIITRIRPLSLNATVITKSEYATGAFTPGEILEIHYAISGMKGGGFLYYGFENQFFNDPRILRVNGNSSGIVKITIPKSAPTGIHIIHMKIVSGESSREALIPVMVNTNPPWSQYLILTFPIADFITIIIVLSSIVVALVYSRYEKPPVKDGKRENSKDSDRTEEPL